MHALRVPWRARRTRPSPLYLPCISPISPPHISHISRTLESATYSPICSLTRSFLRSMICMLPGQGGARVRVRVIGLGLGSDDLHVTGAGVI